MSRAARTEACKRLQSLALATARIEREPRTLAAALVAAREALAELSPAEARSVMRAQGYAPGELDTLAAELCS